MSLSQDVVAVVALVSGALGLAAFGTLHIAQRKVAVALENLATHDAKAQSVVEGNRSRIRQNRGKSWYLLALSLAFIAFGVIHFL